MMGSTGLHSAAVAVVFLAHLEWLPTAAAAATATATASGEACVVQRTFGCFQEVNCGADVHKRCISGMMIKPHGAGTSPEACACACQSTGQGYTLAGLEMGACFCDHGSVPNATRCGAIPPPHAPSECPRGAGGPCAVQVFSFACAATSNASADCAAHPSPPAPAPRPGPPPSPPAAPCQKAPCSLPRQPPLIPGVYCKSPYNQCPELNGEGTVPGTCDVGSPGCNQGPQCQSREDNPYMPIFHLVGNYTRGVGTQPTPINDVSSIIRYRGVLHVFHQFGQCGWAHAVSYDGAHWKNVRYPIIPDTDPKHVYDACGCYDGSLTHHPAVNDGNPIALYDISPALDPAAPPVRAGTDDEDGEGKPNSQGGSGDRPIQGVARPADLNDPELQYWVKDTNNPVVGHLAGYPSQIWKNGDHYNYLAGGTRVSTQDPSFHEWTNSTRGQFPGGGAGGQWFQPLPPTADGRAAPEGSPDYVVSTGGGNVFAVGHYHANNESFTVMNTCTVDHSRQFGWAGMQMAGGRMFNIAWVHGQNSGPNSALSLLRELNYDSAVKCLVSKPMLELSLLRNGSLYSRSALTLPSKVLTTLPVGELGHTIDLEAVFTLPPSGAAASFGLAVLANVTDLTGAVTVKISVSAVDPAGKNRTGFVVVERQQGGPGQTPTPMPSDLASVCDANRQHSAGYNSLCWQASFELFHDEPAEVSIKVLVDRSIVETFVAGGRAAGEWHTQIPHSCYCMAQSCCL